MSYKELDAVPNFLELENKIIEYWKQLNPVEKLKDLRKGAKEKVYYDGPITANNLPHYGHAIQWTIKDLVPRYWSMKNYFVSRNMGWDCQGIPVEFEIEKALGFESKDDIEKFGVAKFNNLCRESVFKYRDSIFHYETRLGRWFDDDDMYYTMDRDFIESMWWSLKELYNKGLLYEGHTVVAYSTRAGTTLSSHEVDSGGYKEVEDPFVTVKFKILSEQKYPNTYLLAWTTTPWTIPGNLMLAVGKKIEYVRVEYDGAFYIVAKEVLGRLFEGKSYTIVKTLLASDLVDIEYETPFKEFEAKRAEGCFKVIYADHVRVDEGTGIVHLAPYGAEDFDVFMRLGITLFDYLDDEAHFTDLVAEYKGLFYKKANPKIIEDLEAKGLLFDSGTILHRLPMCWRTDTPLIYKPIKSWYVAVTKIKDKLIQANKTVNWVPAHVGTGRAGDWIQNARDWALSRKRYWGTPLPLWINDKTGEQVFVGSFEEVEKLSGAKIEDPHKPYVDEITWEDKKNGGVFRRVPDVIDVWYDSGAMPFAQNHYPFGDKKLMERRFPAEFICEATEQARLWFYTMLVLGIALFDKVPYKNVVAHGILLDKNSKKLSKSKKNYPPMDAVLNEFGGDILRYFILNSPIVQAENARFYNEVLLDARKEFFIPLWNCVKYFNSYANLYNFVPTAQKPAVTDDLNKWILVRLQETTNLMNQELDEYLIMEAARAMQPFISDLSTWYIRRSRDRIKNGDQEALHTLYYVLSQFTKLIAPLLPFISEELYESLALRKLTGLESVHFDFYPEAVDLTSEDTALLEKMQNTRNIVSLALSIRVQTGVKVRQPLSNLYILPINQQITQYDENLIKDEVNIKNVALLTNQLSEDKNPVAGDKNFKVCLDTTITEDLKIEGAARELVRKIQDMRKEQGLEVSDKIAVTYTNEGLNTQAVEHFGDEIKEKVQAQSLNVGDNFAVQKVY